MANSGDSTQKQERSSSGPAVYVVATPIGNLEDLTPRARRVLQAADIIAAEDTRQAKKLLSFLEIRGKQLISYHDHGEAERAAALVDRLLAEGSVLALISDAGTPCISDPGYRLVAAAKAADIPVHPVPGASALTALASASGLATNRLLFVGFLPTKASALRAEIESWRTTRASIIFFESVRRLGATLGIIQDIYPGARVAVGRELTKLHEEIVTLPIDEACRWLSGHATLKGEAAVMVELPPEEPQAAISEDALIQEAAHEFTRGATLKDLLTKYKEAGLSRPRLYQLLLKAKDASQSR